MNKQIFKILPLILSIMFCLACAKEKKSSESSGSILTFDETENAVKLVKEANDDLKKIKERFNKIEEANAVAELEKALKAKEAAKVRSISDELATQIIEGTAEGKQAIEKLKTAERMDINEDFKKYLGLKIESLELYVDAFDQRRQAANILTRDYDPKDKMKSEKALGEFKQKEEKFKEILEDARRASGDANLLAQESMNRKN